MKEKTLSFFSDFSQIKRTWKEDLVAGVLVGIVLVPQALAYSQMAGMPAHFGLYASFIPLIIASLFGSSKLLSTGPAVVISLLSLSAVSKLAPANSQEFIAYSALLAIFVGVIQLLFGVLKLGNVVHFVSNSVILGFVNAAAILIIFSQVIKIANIPVIQGKHEAFSMIYFFQKNLGINYESLVIGILSLFILIAGKKKSKKLPLPLLVIIFASLYTSLFGYSGPVVGELPTGLPSLQIPIFSFEAIKILIQPAIIVALVAYMNGISVAKTIALKTKEGVMGNKELIGQGMANISAGLLGSSAVGASLSRTALNYSMGAKTRLASIISGLFVGIVLVFFTGVLKNIPQTVLAAIILVSVLQIISYKQFKELFDNYKYDGLVAVITLIATLVFSPNLELGVVIGIIASGFVYIHRSSYSSILVFKANDTQYASEHEIEFQDFKTNNTVLAVSIDRSLIFTNAEDVSDKILLSVNKRKNIEYVLIMCRSVNFIDATAVKMLEHLHATLKEKGITLVIANLQPQVFEFVKKLELFNIIGERNFFKYVNKALEDISKR